VRYGAVIDTDVCVPALRCSLTHIRALAHLLGPRLDLRSLTTPVWGRSARIGPLEA
jgi:hypothetical protein